MVLGRYAAPIDQVEGLVPGLTVDHLCRVRNCVNPLHLEQVPAVVNYYRGVPFWPRKTQCPRGHEYATKGYVNPKTGARLYRECNRFRMRVTRALG